MGQGVHEIGGEGVPHPPGVVVEQHGGAGDAFGNGLEVLEQLVIGGLEEHGLEHADAGGSVGHGHFGQTAALLGADGANAEVDGDAASGLIHHNLQAPLHLVLFYHIELAVAAKGQNTGHAALDDVVHLVAEPGLVNALLPVDGGEYGHHDALDKIRIHDRSPRTRVGRPYRDSMPVSFL